MNAEKKSKLYRFTEFIFILNFIGNIIGWGLLGLCLSLAFINNHLMMLSVSHQKPSTLDTFLGGLYINLFPLEGLGYHILALFVPVAFLINSCLIIAAILTKVNLKSLLSQKRAFWIGIISSLLFYVGGILFLLLWFINAHTQD